MGTLYRSHSLVNRDQDYTDHRWYKFSSGSTFLKYVHRWNIPNEGSEIDPSRVYHVYFTRSEKFSIHLRHSRKKEKHDDIYTVVTVQTFSLLVKMNILQLESIGVRRYCHQKMDSQPLNEGIPCSQLSVLWTTHNT